MTTPIFRLMLASGRQTSEYELYFVTAAIDVCLSYISSDRAIILSTVVFAR